MKSKEELKELFQAYSRSEMTVENIALKAKEVGVKLIVLTPHYHIQLKDSETVLYEDTDERILSLWKRR